MKNRIFIDSCSHWLLETDYPVAGGYDVIYIDPPYDTRTQLSYLDRRDDWADWMASLMTGARRALRGDGVMFVSIDDNRLTDLCAICDAEFGRRNRLAIMITHQAQRSNAKHVNVVHEYVVVYAKDKRKLPALAIPRTMTQDAPVVRSLESEVGRAFSASGREAAQDVLRKAIARHSAQDGTKWLLNYRFVDDEGRIFYATDLSVPGDPAPVDVPEIGLHLDPLPTRRWSTPEKIRGLAEEGRLQFLNGRPYEKHYLDDAMDSLTSILPFYSRQGTEELKRLGCGGLFDTPKPPALIETLVLAVASGRERTRVLDFFGGSGTTAQAVWQASDKLGEGHDLSFDLVQADEMMREGSRPYRTAVALGIEPTIPAAMRRRIEAFAERGGDREYEFVWVSAEGDEGNE